MPFDLFVGQRWKGTGFPKQTLNSCIYHTSLSASSQIQYHAWTLTGRVSMFAAPMLTARPVPTREETATQRDEAEAKGFRKRCRLIPRPPSWRLATF